MPSNAYAQFLWDIETVNRLQITYEEIKSMRKKGGKGAYDHITRSAIIFLISAFEVYCENVMKETSIELVKRCKDAILLPKEVQKNIAIYVRNNKNEMEPIKLCDEGWREVYKGMVENEIKRFNTPSSKNIKEYFKKNLGVDEKKINNVLTINNQVMLDTIITFRGEITHRVRADRYVHMDKVEECKKEIQRIVVEFDKLLCNHISSHSKDRKQPWRKTYK